MISKKDISKLEGLLYLYALSKSSSKREVAEELGTSVDTINKYLSDLEAEMKTKFMVSGGRGTIITPEGQRILKVSESIVKAIRGLGDYAENAAAYKGIVRIGMPDAIADYVGTQNLVDFSEKYPDITIESYINNKLPNMSTLEADICIDYSAPQDSDLVLLKVKEVKCGLFASKKYIEKRGMPKSWDDLLENHNICDKDNHELYVPKWKEMMAKAKHFVFKTNSIFSLRSALLSGLGIGICPIFYARDNSSNLVQIETVDFDFTIKLYLMAHKDTKDMPRIRAAIDFLNELLDERPN